MAIKEDVTVRLGLDKSGFDSGLTGAGKSLKKFASFFGIATSAVFLKRVIGDVGELASEVSKLREESIAARDVFDKMASGMEVIGDVAGVTADQMDKMRKASQMFTPEQLDGLAKGATLWGKIKDLTSQSVGKLAAFTVNAGSAFFGVGSDIMSGRTRRVGGVSEGVGGQDWDSDVVKEARSDRAISKLLRDERERLRILDEQKETRDWQKQMLAEEEYAIDQIRVKEQDRLDIEREKLALKIQGLEKDQEAARMSREQAKRDRSGFSLAALAAMDNPQSAGGAKASAMARQVEMIEAQAREARLAEFGAAPMNPREAMRARNQAARGFKAPLTSAELTDKALEMRGEIEPLTSNEKSPIETLGKIEEELKTLRALATGQGLIIQPRMSK